MENYGRLRKNAPQELNSMDKFVHLVRQNKSNGEFCKAEDMLPPSYFSKLSLKRPAIPKLAPIFNKDNFPRKKKKSLNEQIPPIGKIEYFSVKKTLNTDKNEDDASVSSKVKLGSELVLITGNVQFIMKNYKLYPDLPALYEIYGKMMKIYKGKIRYEYKILVRSESGPVLQGIYFDFYNLIDSFSTNLIRCVGQFTRQHYFHIHKIQEIAGIPSDAVLIRIQNVSAFVLLQSQNK